MTNTHPLFIKAPADAQRLHAEAKRLERLKQRKNYWTTYGKPTQTQTGGPK